MCVALAVERRREKETDAGCMAAVRVLEDPSPLVQKGSLSTKEKKGNKYYKNGCI